MFEDISMSYKKVARISYHFSGQTMETKIQVKSKALRNVKGDHMQIILPNSESKTGARFDPRFDSEIASLSI